LLFFAVDPMIADVRYRSQSRIAALALARPLMTQVV